MSINVSKSAKYYDGKTGNPREVALTLTGVSFQLVEDKKVIETWSVNDITVIDRPAPPVPGIFGSKKNKDARIYIDDAAEWKQLHQHLPSEAKKKFVLPNNWSSFILYIAVAMISTVFLFMMFPKLVEQTAYLIPYELEKTIGEQAATSLVKGKKECIAPEGRTALDKVFQKLKAQTSRKIKYKIFVVEDEFMLNAFAAPGGYLFIFSKVIESAKTPEEVVGVLSHEISHIDLYHTTKGIMRTLGMQFVLSMMIGGTSAEGLANFLSQMTYSREDETEADLHGRQIMINAKIDPKGIRRFFESIKSFENEIYDEMTKELKKEDNSEETKNTLDKLLKLPIWEYLSTHPNTNKRVKRLRDLENKATFLPPLNKQEWQNLKNICNETKPLKL